MNPTEAAAIAAHDKAQAELHALEAAERAESPLHAAAGGLSSGAASPYLAPDAQSVLEHRESRRGSRRSGSARRTREAAGQEAELDGAGGAAVGRREAGAAAAAAGSKGTGGAVSLSVSASHRHPRGDPLGVELGEGEMPVLVPGAAAVDRMSHERPELPQRPSGGAGGAQAHEGGEAAGVRRGVERVPSARPPPPPPPPLAVGAEGLAAAHAPGRVLSPSPSGRPSPPPPPPAALPGAGAPPERTSISRTSSSRPRPPPPPPPPLGH